MRKQFIYYQNPKAVFYDCKGRFVSDLVGNPNCSFSHAQAHFSYLTDPDSLLASVTTLGVVISGSASQQCHANGIKNGTSVCPCFTLGIINAKKPDRSLSC